MFYLRGFFVIKFITLKQFLQNIYLKHGFILRSSFEQQNNIIRNII
jgi:hypothetical protein